MKITAGASSDSDLALSLDVPYQTLNSWKKRNSIPFDVILSLCEKHNKSLDYMIFGDQRSPEQGIDWHANFECLYLAVIATINTSGFEEDKRRSLIANVEQHYRISMLRSERLAEQLGCSLLQAVEHERKIVDDIIAQGGGWVMPGAISAPLWPAPTDTRTTKDEG